MKQTFKIGDMVEIIEFGHHRSKLWYQGRIGTVKAWDGSYYEVHFPAVGRRKERYTWLYHRHIDSAPINL